MLTALDRLSSLGYIDTAFFTLRPWTRLSVAHMLEQTEPKLDENPKDVTAREIFSALMNELLPDLRASAGQRPTRHGLRQRHGNRRRAADGQLSLWADPSSTTTEGRTLKASTCNWAAEPRPRRAGLRRTSGRYQHAPGLPAYPPEVQDWVEEPRRHHRPPRLSRDRHA